MSLCSCKRQKQELLSKHRASILPLVRFDDGLHPRPHGIAPSCTRPFAEERLCSRLHNAITSVAVRISSDLYEAKSTCSKQLRQDGESTRAPILETDAEIRNSTKEQHRSESNNNN